MGWGAHARYAAGRYSDLVAGVVYLDPTDPALTRDEEREVYVTAGLGEMAGPAYEMFRAGTRSYVARSPPAIRRELEAMEALHDLPLGARALPEHPDIPVAVVLSARMDPGPPGFPPDAYEAWARAYVDLRVERFGDLVRSASDGLLVVASDVGHHVHLDDLELVLSVIRRVLL